MQGEQPFLIQSGLGYFFFSSFFLLESSHFDLQQSDFVVQSDLVVVALVSAFFVSSFFLSSACSTFAATGAAETGTVETPINATSAIRIINFFMIFIDLNE